LQRTKERKKERKKEKQKESRKRLFDIFFDIDHVGQEVKVKKMAPFPSSSRVPLLSLG